MLSAPRPPSAGRIQHSPSWHRAGQGEELQPSSQPVPPASPQPRATDKDLATPSPPNRSGHASFSHTPLSLCISGSLRQPAQLRAALPAAGRQLRAQRGSGQPPRGSVREGTAPLRSEPGRPRAPRTRLNGAAKRGAPPSSAPCPHAQRDGHGNSSLASNERPRMAHTAARHPRSCSGKLMRAGRRRSGADSRLSAARGETPLYPRAVALCPRRPSFPRRRAPSGPPPALLPPGQR